MGDCPICQHAKVDVIQAALDRGRLVPMVARAFRVHPDVLQAHVDHQAVQDVLTRAVALVEDLSTDVLSAPCTCPWCVLSPYRRLRQAWDEVSRLDKERFCVEMRSFDVPF